MNRITSIRPQRSLIAVTLTATLCSTSLMAAEVDNAPQHIGAGTGAVAGAVIAGPIGAILGTAFGTLIGHQQVQQDNLQSQQQAYDQLSQKLHETYSELAAAEAHLKDRHAELAVVEQQMQSLNQEHRALQEMVGGLKLSVYFAQNSSRVDPRYEELLQSLSDGATKVKGLNIKLEGHTNKSGDAPYNQMLSERRGNEVGNRLQQHGLPPFRLMTQGNGADEVTSSNPYAADDRRVDLEFRFDDSAERLVSER